MSFIFRAYHAMARQRGMSTRKGLPTAAIYVFVNMLRKLRDDFSPQYLAAVFDVAAPTFRDQQYKQYKANRTAMPGDLAQQIPYIRRALEAYRIPILEVPGYEADDVIGTLAAKAANQGRNVYVVSSDKDMLQLVNDRVLVLNPPKDNLICDADKVEEVLGVRPERVIDVMALRGDSIDNIPGAPGIGDKGSVEIIRRFGSLEAALDRAREVERKAYRESLETNREQILLSKELVTINCDVGIELDVEKMHAGEPDLEALRALFTELEFTSLLKELLPVIEVPEGNYRETSSREDVESILASRKPEVPLSVAIDLVLEPAKVEEEAGESEEELLPLSITDALPAARATQTAVAIEPGSALAVSRGSPAEAALQAALRSPEIPKAIHDWKTAAHSLGDRELARVEHDTRLYSYLLDPTYSSHGLPAVALRRFNLKLAGSVAEAADITGRLAAVLRREVEEEKLLKLYEEIDLPLVPVLTRMERAGVEIDRGALGKMSKRLEREIESKAREIYECCGGEFNINSPKQLGDVLFNKLGMPKPVKYGKGRTISTAVDVLEELAASHKSPAPGLVLEYRQLAKLKSTYVDALPALLDSATGRLHSTFDQTGTATGRLSSANPNLQNIPIRTELGREIRAAFTARPGSVLLAADYSQIELRLLAHYANDRLLVEAFRRGDDIHTLTASQVFRVPPLLVTPEHRRRAKVVNFGIVYGLSPFGLAQNLGIETAEAKKYIDAYFDQYSGVRAFIDRTLDETRRDGRVKTLFGRMRPIPDINSKNYNLRGFAERTAVNTPLQGTAADLIKLAMIRIDGLILERGLKSKMTLQVHDELVFEVPGDEIEVMRGLVREQMENVHPLAVPLVVEVGVGKNWRDLE
ncbi:MAG: DNA polymerase I [Acidobacteria bacterium]|nr:DNA polymerase I [Acidobacteriota bacterium]